MRQLELVVHFGDPSWARRETSFLRTHRAADLEGPARPRLEIETTAWEASVAQLGQALAMPCGRLYLGNEFCPYLDWTADEILSSCELAADSGLQFSLVFGAVRERDFSDKAAVVRDVVSRFGAIEVVANDWGLLAALAGLGARPVAGRLLFRAKRLPRLSRSVLPDSLDPGISAGEVSRAQLVELAECPWDTPWERAMAERLGVTRADVEMVPQGLATKPSGLSLSLHLPFTSVTGGGICPVSQILVREGRTVCTRRCRSTAILPRFPVRTWELVQIGQSVFMPAHSLLRHYRVHERIDRLILEPGLPM